MTVGSIFVITAKSDKKQNYQVKNEEVILKTSQTLNGHKMEVVINIEVVTNTEEVTR